MTRPRVKVKDFITRVENGPGIQNEYLAHTLKSSKVFQEVGVYKLVIVHFSLWTFEGIDE